MRRLLGYKIISLEDEWKEIKPVECASAESRFGIFLKNLISYGAPTLSIKSEVKPDAEAVIKSPLLMRPGKGLRFECCDVPTIVEIRPEKLGPRNVEASRLKIDVGDVKIEKGCIYAGVQSLNHAYTTASLRLEPHRRSHGGRVYDHLALRGEDGNWGTLESIRVKKERLAREKLIV